MHKKLCKKLHLHVQSKCDFFTSFLPPQPLIAALKLKKNVIYRSCWYHMRIYVKRESWGAFLHFLFLYLYFPFWRLPVPSYTCTCLKLCILQGLWLLYKKLIKKKGVFLWIFSIFTKFNFFAFFFKDFGILLHLR